VPATRFTLPVMSEIAWLQNSYHFARPQTMRNQRADYGLIGSVQLVKTTLSEVSTKSYKLHPSGREVWEDFGNPSAGSPGDPSLWNVLKFDVNGRLIESIDVERSLIEQKPYRYVYAYDATGRLAKKISYREDGSSDLNITYRYASTDKKIEALFCSEDGRVQSRAKFDERENMIVREFYSEDGSLMDEEHHRYEYSTKGEVLEQMYYPPSRRVAGGGFFSPVLGFTAEKPTVIPAPLGWRTVYVHDNSGRVREEHRYDVDGSPFETKIFDENGVVRKKEWRLGSSTSTTTLLDEAGRELQIHTLAKKGAGSPRDFDDLTIFSYDGQGNMAEMVTKGPDGAMVHRISNVYRYDDLGNWIEKTETELDNTWKTEPFPAAFETVRIFHRNFSYF
jgi:antitoxin component YwqK of YwqJK toxin-antitoxin module